MLFKHARLKFERQGVQNGLQRDLNHPGALACSVTPSTLLRLVGDLVDSLERQGLRKLVLLNGHGGNELKPLLRQLHHKTEAFLCVCDWFRVAADQYPGYDTYQARAGRRIPVIVLEPPAR